MQLIQEKITLPATQARPKRWRLLEFMTDSLAIYNSTVIYGRAGSGKTTLAAEAARQSSKKVAWYKVDSSDNDHRAFLRYLMTSIGQQLPGFDLPTMLDFAAQADLGDLELAAELLVPKLFECGDIPLLIVIDDLHLVYDSEWLAPFFGRLMPLLPANDHLVLVGRSLPPAPLWRMRSKQTLGVIEEALLAFTREEIYELFRHYGLSQMEADEALKLTHGRAERVDQWATRMAAQRAEWTLV